MYASTTNRWRTTATWTYGFIGVDKVGLDSPVGGGLIVDHMINSIYPLIITTDLAHSTAFYRDVLGLVPVFEADWYAQFQSPDQAAAQLALIVPEHDSVPERFWAAAAGVIISLEVDDVDTRWEAARDAGAEMIVDVRDEPWGQRHFVTVDPNGLMIDVVQSISEETA